MTILIGIIIGLLLAILVNQFFIFKLLKRILNKKVEFPLSDKERHFLELKELQREIDQSSWDNGN